MYDLDREHFSKGVSLEYYVRLPFSCFSFVMNKCASISLPRKFTIDSVIVDFVAISSSSLSFSKSYLVRPDFQTSPKSPDFFPWRADFEKIAATLRIFCANWLWGCIISLNSFYIQFRPSFIGWFKIELIKGLLKRSHYAASKLNLSKLKDFLGQVGFGSLKIVKAIEFLNTLQN